MRSTRRGRDRSRLATSKPVNVMFSNGLGVCKSGNAGIKSICLKKATGSKNTKSTVAPTPSLATPSLDWPSHATNPNSYYFPPNLVPPPHPATYHSGEVTDAAPTKIILTFNKPIAANASIAAADFSIGGTTSAVPTAAAVVAGRVELTVATVTNSQEITVGYTKSNTTAQNIADIDGNIIPTFGGDQTEFRLFINGYGVVINRVGAPVLWPPRSAARVLGASIGGDPSIMILTFTKPIVTISSVTLTDFDVNPNYGGSATNIELLSNGKIKITMSAPTNGGQGGGVTVAFTKTSTVLEDAAGLQLVNFTAQQILNLT